MYLNKAMVIGNLTRDPETKALPSGIKVCNFSVATNRTWKDKNGAKQETTGKILQSLYYLTPLGEKILTL
jgi:single-strand DNA-binding protein